MKLKLWQKSFLLTYTMFLVLLNAGLVTWYLFDVKTDYRAFADDCRQEAENILYFAERTSEEDAGWQLEKMADRYESRGVYLKLTDGDAVLADRIPAGVHDAGETYYHIHLGFNTCRLDYMRSLEGVVERYWNMAWWVCLVDLILAAAVGALLHAAMKKIYKPVSDISHQLRTPLTSVLGYAQYLSMGHVTDADKEIAGRRILEEANYMKDIVERLLTVESLRGSSVKKEKIDFDGLVEELRRQYPAAHYENHIGGIEGDPTLVKIMLSNLMENAMQEDPDARFMAKGNVIKIANKTDRLDAQDIRNMNRGKPPVESKIRGHGLGLALCMEIAARHGWTLHYALTEDDGLLCSLTIQKTP